MSVARIPFSSADTQVIRTLAAAAMALAGVQGLISVPLLLYDCMALLDLFLGGRSPILAIARFLSGLCFVAVMIAQAVPLIQMRRALTEVVRTDSNDQGQMAEAFAKLRLFCLLEVLWSVAAIARTIVEFMTLLLSPTMSQSPTMPLAQPFGGGP